MKQKQLKSKLENLVSQWKASNREYSKFMLTTDYPNLERSRYEGIATGYRWAYEDLERLLSEVNK